MSFSIRAKKLPNSSTYAVDSRSSKQVVPQFSIITKNRFNGLSFDAEPHAPKGDYKLCAQIMKKLCDEYPGYVWMVMIDDRPNVGMVNIINQDINAELFSNMPYGYQLHLSKVQNDPSLRCVIMKAGEILERARLTRGRAKGEQIKSVDGVKQEHQPFKINNVNQKYLKIGH